MSNPPPVSRSYPCPKDKPRLFIWEILGVSLFLLLLLLLSLRLLYTLWPGSEWVQAWHDGESRRLAAETVAEAGGKRIAETLDLLARLEGGDAKGLPAAQISVVNTTLAYAQQIIVRCGHDCPDTQAHLPQNEIKGRLEFTPSGLAASAKLRSPVSPTPVATWTPLGPGVPNRLQRQTLRDHLLLAQKLLVCRLRAGQTPVAAPGVLDILFQTPPERSHRPPAPPSPCKARSPQPSGPDAEWGLLPDEVKLYNQTYLDGLAANPPAFLGSSELNYFVIIFLFGILGACVRSLASLSTFVGNRSFRPRWSLYYFTQPFIGGGLSMAFYTVLRGGFMSTESSAAVVTNLYACSALGVLVGVATKEAQQKIQDIAEQFFADDQDNDNPDADDKNSTRSDARKPLIKNVELSPDHLGGTVRGLNLWKAQKLYLNDRLMEIVANDRTSIHFRVPAAVSGSPAPTPLAATDLRSVVVETDKGAASAFDHTVPPKPTVSGMDL